MKLCKTFKKKYELEADSEGFHKPKGGPIKAIQIDENISFVAPWGETMNIAKGGYLVVNGPNDIYGIQEEEFYNTYKLSAEVDKMFESKNVDDKTKKVENDMQRN